MKVEPRNSLPKSEKEHDVAGGKTPDQTQNRPAESVFDRLLVVQHAVAEMKNFRLESDRFGNVTLKVLNFVKFLQSHQPMTETFRSCLKIYLYNMSQTSTGSSSVTKVH